MTEIMTCASCINTFDDGEGETFACERMTKVCSDCMADHAASCRECGE